MVCHECLMAGERRVAVALCPHCLVGLCKEHLVALHRAPVGGLVPTCSHQPGQPAPADVFVPPTIGV